MIPGLDTPELVHVAMLRGTIATISLRQCAHVHGDKVMEQFNRWDELRGDLKTTSDVLIDFAGEHAWQQAQSAVQHIEWLKRELSISQYNERAATEVVQQQRKEIAALYSRMEHVRWSEESQGGSRNEQEARQTSGSEGQV